MNEHSRNGSLLIVDDDEDFAVALKESLEIAGYECLAAQSEQEALDSIRDFDPDVALIDIRLGRDDGTRTLEKLKSMRPNLLCIMMTAHGNLKTSIDSLRRGAFDYLEKPFELEALHAALDRGLEFLALRRDRHRAHERLDAKTQALETVAQSLLRILQSFTGVADSSLDDLGSRSTVAIRVTDEAGRVSFADDYYCTATGWPLAELLGRHLSELVAEPSQTTLERQLAELRAGQSARGLVAMCTASDEIFSGAVTAVPLFDREQRYRGACELIELPEALGKTVRERSSRDVGTSLPPEMLAELSKREREVLKVALSGHRVKEMAETLSLSPHTVRNHLRSIYRKLDVHSRAQLVAKIGNAGRHLAAV